MFSEQERGALEHIKSWGFTDAYRLHVKDGGHFTWWDYRAGAFRRNLGLRIDHMWISESLVGKSVRSWIDPDPRKWEKPSDHAPVITEIV
jgi:exodeoxyribonuclease-3